MIGHHILGYNESDAMGYLHGNNGNFAFTGWFEEEASGMRYRLEPAERFLGKVRGLAFCTPNTSLLLY